MLAVQLRALVFAVWSAIHPGPLPSDADAIADAIVEAIVFRSKGPPVLGSHDLDLVAMALWADGESALRLHPPARSHDAKDHKSCSVWQEPCAFVWTHTLRDQARYWIWLLHEGARICPESPAADLSGGCTAGRGLADRRVLRARTTLQALLAIVEQEE